MLDDATTLQPDNVPGFNAWRQRGRTRPSESAPRIQLGSRSHKQRSRSALNSKSARGCLASTEFRLPGIAIFTNEPNGAWQKKNGRMSRITPKPRPRSLRKFWHERLESPDTSCRSVRFLAPKSTSAITSFYKGECQEKNFPGDWKERKCSPRVPAHVML